MNHIIKRHLFLVMEKQEIINWFVGIGGVIGVLYKKEPVMSFLAIRNC